MAPYGHIRIVAIRTCIVFYWYLWSPSDTSTPRYDPIFPASSTNRMLTSPYLTWSAHLPDYLEIYYRPVACSEVAVPSNTHSNLKINGNRNGINSFVLASNAHRQLCQQSIPCMVLPFNVHLHKSSLTHYFSQLNFTSRVHDIQRRRKRNLRFVTQYNEKTSEFISKWNRLKQQHNTFTFV